MLNAIALSTFITIGGWSVHYDSGYERCIKHSCERLKYNYNHNMIMLEHKGYTLGAFKNSYNHKSQIAGYTLRKGNYSALVGLSTGYEGETECVISADKLCAIVALSYSFEPLKLTLLGEALAVSFEFKM